DRPLNARGLRDAPRMAAYMHSRGYIPDVALCSPAQRTRETIDAVSPVVGEFPISYPEILYLAETETIRALVASLDDAYGAALVVGHNPGIGSLASQITDFDDLEDARQVMA